MLTACLLVFLTAIPAFAGQDRAEFFFYSPDFGPGNLNVLTEAANAYFAEIGLEIRFQPFARFEDFQRELRERRPAFVIVPHWVVQSPEGSKLIPLALPVRNGKHSGRKALMAGKGIGAASDIGSGSVAVPLSSVNATRGSDVLRTFTEEHPKVHIIPVPKDIDALLALGFGQVEASFIATAQVEMLQRVNPNLTRDLHEIGYAEEIPLPQLYSTPQAGAAQAAKLSRALVEANETALGRHLTALLGYDRWESVSSSEPLPRSSKNPPLERPLQ